MFLTMRAEVSHAWLLEWKGVGVDGGGQIGGKCPRALQFALAPRAASVRA